MKLTGKMYGLQEIIREWWAFAFDRYPKIRFDHETQQIVKW